MKVFIVDAFTDEIFMGNQAGVVILDKEKGFPADQYMTSLAAELKHSETAFVIQQAANQYKIRYFTAVGEVDLCGHATISLFTVLRDFYGIKPGLYRADTLAGLLNIEVQESHIWMDMAVPKAIYEFKDEEKQKLYEAFALDVADVPNHLQPKIISTGLCDILLPVKTKEHLDNMKIDAEIVCQISKQYHVIGIHAFCCGDGSVTAYCRNYAPLYGITEESATGTANGALTYYLNQYGYIQDAQKCTYIQGEMMGRRSMIRAVINDGMIKVGGQAVISLIGETSP